MNATPQGDVGTSPHETPAEATSPSQTPEEAPGNGLAPPSVLSRLRGAYARAQESKGDRRKTILIVPGRYEGLLGVRFRPIPWDEQRKRVMKAQRQGGGAGNAEVELDYAAGVIAEACETIMLRDEASGELLPATEAVREFAGQDPVRFDSRLLSVLGIDVPSADRLRGKSIVRLVYDNPAALNSDFGALQAWLSEEQAGDEDDEERPT